MDAETPRLNRQPPEPVKRALRTEVGFGCPVEGCRKPFLTWHHFDPPWSVEQHHKPEGMVALCTEHHPQADAGAFSKDRLRALKAGPHPVVDVKGRFPWSPASFLVRLGGNYTLGTGSVLSINNEQIIGLSRNEHGLLDVSFVFRDVSSIPFATMAANAFECENAQLYDLDVDTGATHLRIWFAQRKVGLDVDFSRLIPAELDEILQRDKARAEESHARQQRDAWKWLLQSLEAEPNPSERIKADIVSLRTLKNEAPLARFIAAGDWSSPKPDTVGDRVRETTLASCLDGDGRIPFLDFRRLETHHSGRKIEIREGLAVNGLRCSYSFFPQGLRVGFDGEATTLG